MVTTNPKSWARKHKKDFANQMITRAGVKAHDEPAAFFMAGLPGAGKTEFTTNLINDLSLKVVRIDMDEIATHIEGYTPEEAHAFREAATDLLNATFDRAVLRRVDFIMDGTFRSKNALKNLQRCEKKGYHTKLIYVHQAPLLAWDFTQSREKVEKRSINKTAFINTYFEIRANIMELRNIQIKNLTLELVVKDSDNSIGRRHENVSPSEIDELVGKIYTRDELERLI